MMLLVEVTPNSIQYVKLFHLNDKQKLLTTGSKKGKGLTKIQIMKSFNFYFLC